MFVDGKMNWDVQYWHKPVRRNEIESYFNSKTYYTPEELVKKHPKKVIEMYNTLPKILSSTDKANTILNSFNSTDIDILITTNKYNL